MVREKINELPTSKVLFGMSRFLMNWVCILFACLVLFGDYSCKKEPNCFGAGNKKLFISIVEDGLNISNQFEEDAINLEEIVRGINNPPNNSDRVFHFTSRYDTHLNSFWFSLSGNLPQRNPVDIVVYFDQNIVDTLSVFSEIDSVGVCELPVIDSIGSKFGNSLFENEEGYFLSIPY